MHEKITTTIRKIDKDLWIEFRKKCLYLGVSANQRIIDLIEIDVKKGLKE